jgi:hypothetical protein
MDVKTSDQLFFQFYIHKGVLWESNFFEFLIIKIKVILGRDLRPGPEFECLYVICWL